MLSLGTFGDTVSETFEARNKDFPHLSAFMRPALEERPS